MFCFEREKERLGSRGKGLAGLLLLSMAVLVITTNFNDNSSNNSSNNSSKSRNSSNNNSKYNSNNSRDNKYNLDNPWKEFTSASLPSTTNDNNDNTHNTPSQSSNRRLQHVEKFSWFEKDESLETKAGVLPTISCPIGWYREAGASSLYRPGGMRQDGCIECPRGRYGSTDDLTSSLCTDPCPAGKYRDSPGATSEQDCRWCPEGTYGSEEGLTTKDCSGFCYDLNTVQTGYYSDEVGLSTHKSCKTCPVGYRGWQCSWDLIPRLGTFSSPSGQINEAAHQYLMQGTDGTWSVDKYAGDYSGAWPTRGAVPESAPSYPGRIKWDTGGLEQEFDFDPAKEHRDDIGVVP